MSKTKVKFLIERDVNGVLAYFPEINHNHSGTEKEAYAHVGQHSGCSIEYAHECRPATKDEYADLRKELTDSVGYDLHVMSPETKLPS